MRKYLLTLAGIGISTLAFGQDLPKYTPEQLIRVYPPNRMGVIGMGYDLDNDGDVDIVESRHWYRGFVSKPFRIWYDRDNDGKLDHGETIFLDKEPEPMEGVKA